ncbi:uncharacterized protein TM35_000042120 [Trypanosoma theileri]|uniref:Uncharacterized protein n=1 Tax=Trypanosoma theileri TaxID=67003 RepID=A0A1X0P582_9TRYP|nr:uncharacterized protein TM35_000042120 [Trypanosoma theileri]ORC91998.1 hypothetical protein TM35_000042120 [Trypanosoma theileri]
MTEINYRSLPPDAAEVNLLYHKIEKLDSDLKKRELHLAELIDEVVYAEDNKDKALRRAESARYLVIQLESLLQDLLGYVKVIEGNVLLPAFLELGSVVPQEPVMNREAISHALQNLSEDNLSTRTKKLITAVQELPSETKNLATREVFMRNMTEERVNIEDAILLCGLLMENKNELTALLSDLSDRIQCILQGKPYETLVEGTSRSVSGFKGAPYELDELQEHVRRLEKERDDLRHQMSVNENTIEMNRLLQEERNLLQEERKTVEVQLLDAQQRLLKEQNKAREVNLRVESLEQSLEQLEHEKGLLQREIKELKRDQVHRSRSYFDEQRAEEEAQQMRAELDSVMTEHSGLRAAMESQLADLKAQNTILLTEKMEYKERLDSKDQQIATLQRINDGLKRELFEVQQKMLSSSFPISINRNGGNKNGNGNIFNEPTTDLNVAEKRLADISSRFEAERKQIIAQFDQERERYKAERQECDALVERMANELEQLAMDNRSLRASVALRQL